MRVALFVPSDNLDEWDWLDFENGLVAASGTDAQAIALAQRLSSAASVDTLVIFKGRSPSNAPPTAIVATDLSTAVERASDWGADVLVFIDRADDDTRRGVEVAEALNVACVIWAQNGPFDDDRRKYATTNAVRRVVCVSHPHADALRHTPLFRKVGVIHNSLLFRGGPLEARRANAVCFLGATVAEKGFHHVVRAWPQIRERHPTATLTVFGSARLYNRSAATGPLNLGSPEFEAEYVTPIWGREPQRLPELGVEIAGLTNPIELADRLHQFTIAVVNPNVTRGASIETFCVSAVEAQAAGCAVVGGCAGGLRETVRRNRTGVLIRREDQLAEAVSNLLAEPGRIAKMAEAGREWAPATFSVATADARWMRLLDDVTSQRAPTAPKLHLSHMTPRTLAREAIRIGRRVARPQVEQP